MAQCVPALPAICCVRSEGGTMAGATSALLEAHSYLVDACRSTTINLYILHLCKTSKPEEASDIRAALRASRAMGLSGGFEDALTAVGDRQEGPLSEQGTALAALRAFIAETRLLLRVRAHQQQQQHQHQAAFVGGQLLSTSTVLEGLQHTLWCLGVVLQLWPAVRLQGSTAHFAVLHRAFDKGQDEAGEVLAAVQDVACRSLAVRSVPGEQVQPNGRSPEDRKRSSPFAAAVSVNSHATKLLEHLYGEWCYGTGNECANVKHMSCWLVTVPHLLAGVLSKKGKGTK